MKFILGKKIGMTQVWKGDNVIAVTKVQAGPCTVTQIRTIEKDGYNAVQLGYGSRKAKNINQPLAGHLKNLGNFQVLREFRLDNDKAFSGQVGDKINVTTFGLGDTIQVTGKSKGRGYQGGVKRHGFHGQGASHGVKDQMRMPGSIGATGKGHVLKGTRMAGRMGNDRISIQNLEVVEIDEVNNIIYIKGGLPGSRNGLIMVKGEGELVLAKAADVEVAATEIIPENITETTTEVTENIEAVSETAPEAGNDNESK